MLFIPLQPLPLECGWATEEGRDGKGNLETGTKLPKIFLCVFLFYSHNDVGDEDGSLAILSPCYLLFFFLAFTEQLWCQKPSSPVSYSSKVVLGDVLVNCIRHPRLISLHTKCTF